MTENVNVSDVQQNQNQVNNTVASNVANVTPTPKYTDEDLNNIVKEKKLKAYEQGKQDQLAEFQKQQSANSSFQSKSPEEPQLTADQRQNLVEEATKNVFQQMQVQQLVHQFGLKMSEGPKQYPDFNEVVGNLKLETMPSIVQLANNFENTKDIMYDLGKNPSKVSSLMVLSQINPQLAQQEMQRLSDSIKKNQDAVANQPAVREPLSHIKPSTAGADNGSMSVSDWRSQPWLRG